MPAALVVYDDGAGRFGPLGDRRTAMEFRTGALTSLERIERLLGRRADALRCPPRLATVLRERSGKPVNTAEVPGLEGGVLAVNARWLGEQAALVRDLPVGACVINTTQTMVAAGLTPVQAKAWLNDPPTLPPPIPSRVQVTDAVVLDRPWQIIEHLEATLGRDLGLIALPPRADLPGNVAVLGDEGVHVAPDARLHPMVVLNCEKGPVVIDRGAVVQSFAVLGGPCYIGAHAIVTPHTHVRANTVIGPHCVVGGEISHSVLHGNSNKCHAGYLGNSLVGQWVNLGADTTVSNLKNTYGPVRMQLSPDAEAEDTGQLKLGPLVGDFVRTAIGTRILTGSCLGTGAMLAAAGFSPKCVDRLRFLTDDGDQPYDLERFLATTRRVLLRRHVTLTAAEEAVLRDLAGRRR